MPADHARVATLLAIPDPPVAERLSARTWAEKHRNRENGLMPTRGRHRGMKIGPGWQRRLPYGLFSQDEPTALLVTPLPKPPKATRHTP